MARGTRKLLIAVSVVVILVIAVYTALQFGEKSPLIASGTVELDPELTEKAKNISTLFIIVRDSNSPAPMPIGAARKTIGAGATGAFYDFVLTKEFLQLMVAETNLPENLTIKARLDVDGMGGADTPGDLVGDVTGIKLGSKGFQIKINREIH